MGQSDLTNEIWRILSDGKPHKIQEFWVLASSILPEQAVRKYRNDHDPQNIASTPLDQQVFMGRKRIITLRLNHFKRIGRITTSGSGSGKSYTATESSNLLIAHNEISPWDLYASVKLAALTGKPAEASSTAAQYADAMCLERSKRACQ